MPHPGFSDSIGLLWGPRTCISNKLPDDGGGGGGGPWRLTKLQRRVSNLAEGDFISILHPFAIFLTLCMF